MINHFELPNNYKEYLTIDLNKKRYLISFNIFVIAITLLIFTVFKIDQCPLFSISSMAVLAIGVFLIIIIHELIHGLFMHLFSGKKATYKMSFFYASAGAFDRYFNNFEYIIIALAPVIFLSIFLLIVLNMVSTNYYNAILFLFAISFTSAVGDFYMAGVTFFQPKNILINDEGEKMHFYIEST